MSNRRDESVPMILITLAAVLCCLSVPGFGVSEPPKLKVKVVDHDSGRGVESGLYLIESDSSKKFMADTDPGGTVETPHACASGERVHAQPKNKAYYDSDDIQCAESLTINVISRLSVKNLEGAAKKAEQKKAYAEAALYFNELQARLRSADSKKADEYQIRAYKDTGKAWNIEVPVVHDALQAQEVMSPSLKQEVLDFQKTSGIPESGKLDYATLSKLSGKNVGQIVSGEAGSAGSPN